MRRTRLITAADVLAGRVASPLVLDDTTILTPSARDQALLTGLVIVERGDADHGAGSGGARAPCACSSGPCSGPCPSCSPRCDAPAWGGRLEAADDVTRDGGRLSRVHGGCHAATLDGLPDGLYLVRDDGRGSAVPPGRMVLPASGPGLLVSSHAARALRASGSAGA